MIPIDQPHLTVAALSHPGEKRAHNEDRYTVRSYQLEEDGIPVVLAIVADGIGGHQAGEIAAELTIGSIVQDLAKSDGRTPESDMQKAVRRASHIVYQASQEKIEQEGMGSTVVIALVIGAKLYTATAGDSRIFLLREDQIRQISVDHTWVQEAIEQGVINAEQAENHPNVHVLRRYVGGPKSLEADLRLRMSPKEGGEESLANQGLQLKQGDQILLASDGLTDLVDDHEIQAILEGQSPKEAVRQLVELARARGGHDNITVVILKVPGDNRRSALGCSRLALALLLVILVLAAALAVTWWLNVWPWTMLGGEIPSLLPTVSAPVTTEGVTEAGIVSTVGPTASLPMAQTPLPTPADTATAIPLPTVAPPEG